MRSQLLHRTLLAHGASRPANDAWLLRGDALELLSLVPTGSVDLVFSDPPYFLSNGGTTVSGGERVAVDKGEWDRSSGLPADHAFHRRWLRECQRILRPTGTLWVSGTQHAIFSVGWAMQLNDWRLLNTITWEKPAPPPNQGCRCFTHSTEFIIWASPNFDEPQRHVFNYDEAKAETGKQMKDVWRFSPPALTEKRHGRHETQKPLALLDRIIELASLPGDLVLDPFCGSGTTGVSALSKGRSFLGIERDEEYFDLANRRIAGGTP